MDKEKLRLVSIVRDGLEPRPSWVDMVWLQMAEKRGVMVIRVPRSWAVPHRVIFLKDMNFYVRNAAGKNPMSVDELRHSFNSSRDLAQRLLDFRGERIEAIVAKDLPLNLMDGVKLVLHIVPLSAVADPLDLQFSQGAPGIVPPLRNASHAWQHTIEGFVTFTMPEPSRSYSMMFRNGAVEGVAALHISDEQGGTFPLQAPEKLVLNGWKTFQTFAGAFGVEPPVYVFATLIEVKGLAPHVDPFGGETATAARKDVLILPEVAVGIDQFAVAPVNLFKRLFDRTANAFGLSRSPSYDGNGNFIGSHNF